MSATLRITIGAEEQHERLREWHDKTHVMHVAHAKAAARQALLSKALAVTVAIFTAITGTTLYASWGTSPSTAARIAVSTIAVLGVVFAAAQTALTPGKHSAEHQQAAARYGSSAARWRSGGSSTRPPTLRTRRRSTTGSRPGWTSSPPPRRSLTASSRAARGA